MLPVDTPEILERVRTELDLVNMVARRISRIIGNVVEYEDLVSAGREGLLDAARRYDPSLGASFRTYARLRITGTIVDEVRKMGGLPRRAYERLSSLRAAGLTKDGPLEPMPIGIRPRDDADIETGVTDQAAAFVVAAAFGAGLADDRHATEGNGHDGEPSTAGYRAADPEQALMHAELLTLLRNGVGRLPGDEKLVLQIVYYEDQTLAEAARRLDCGKSWAKRLHSQAMQRLGLRLRPRV